MTERTFWNYEPTPARIVRVIVGKADRPTWWCADLEGTEREAVEVNYHGDKFYLDNDAFEGGVVGGYEQQSHPAGSGWAKVTQGRGGPDWGHSSLTNCMVRAASVDRSPEGQDAQRLDRNDESAVGESRDAPKQSLRNERNHREARAAEQAPGDNSQ